MQAIDFTTSCCYAAEMAAEDSFTEHNALDEPQEVARAKERFSRQQEAVRRQEGAGATEAAQAITREYLAKLAGAIKCRLDERSGKSVHREFLALIRGLDPTVLAACVLWGAQHSIGQRDDCRDTALRIGGLIADECWARKLTEDRPLLAEHVEHRARRIPTTAAEPRKKIARTLAARYGYKEKNWDGERLLRAGEWSLSVLLEALPDVFKWEAGQREDDKPGEDQFLTFTDQAKEFAATAIAHVVEKKSRMAAATRSSKTVDGLERRWHLGQTAQSYALHHASATAANKRSCPTGYS